MVSAEGPNELHEQGHGGAEHSRRIEIYMEDNGETVHLDEPLNLTIGEIITEFYRDFVGGRERDPEDRLQCEDPGSTDIFQFSSLSLESFLEAGHCRELKWKFSGKIGGA